jgi:hypothetical protein
MAKQGKPGGAGKPPTESKLVTDSRFAAVHHDPRFQRFPKAKAKVEIDERFAGGHLLSRLTHGAGQKPETWARVWARTLLNYADVDSWTSSVSR